MDVSGNFERILQFKVVGAPSLLFYDNYILSFSGYMEHAVERANWNGTHVTSSEILNEHESDCQYPVIFETFPDACSDSCENYCFP
jgi:hypothetical protein